MGSQLFLCFLSGPLIYFQAANYLNIKSLLDLTCQTVADMIKGKTPEEIRKTFNIKNDFTPEEEEEVRRENAWAFEWMLLNVCILIIFFFLYRTSLCGQSAISKCVASFSAGDCPFRSWSLNLELILLFCLVLVFKQSSFGCLLWFCPPLHWN